MHSDHCWGLCSISECGITSDMTTRRVLSVEDPMASILKPFGMRLKSLRLDQKLDMKNAAAALGMAETTLYAYERGDASPAFSTLTALAKLYKVDEAALFIWPDTHLRHQQWELLRLASNDEIASAKPALEKLFPRSARALETAAESHRTKTRRAGRRR